MRELIAILWAVCIAYGNLRKKNIRTKLDLHAYRGILDNVRYLLLAGIVESEDESSLVAHEISQSLVGLLDTQIEELDNLIQLDPLVLGILEK